jgi:hypothetical protein
MKRTGPFIVIAEICAGFGVLGSIYAQTPQQPETRIVLSEVVQSWKMPSPVFLGQLLCGQDGNIVGQFVTGPHLDSASIVAVGPETAPVIFDMGRVEKIEYPSLVNFDAFDGGVLMLLSGSRKSDFDGLTSPSKKALRGETVYVLARFSSKGELKESTVLDLPFTPAKAVAISDQHLMILGSSKINAEPVMALTDSSGTLLRYFDVPLPSLQQLIEQQSEDPSNPIQPPAGSENLPTSNRVLGSLLSYSFAHHGDKLLLYRSRTAKLAKVLELSDSGASRLVSLQLPPDKALLSILPSDGGHWIAHAVSGDRVAPYLLDFDPEDGTLVTKLVTVNAPASTILCEDHGKFYGYRSLEDGKTSLIEGQR